MTTYELDGQTVTISKPERLYFPESGITKGEFVQYHHDVASVMLTHLRDRPIAMLRYVKGIAGPSFYQKRFPKTFPRWIEHVDVVNTVDEEVQFVVVQNAASLVYIANQGCITFHAFTAPTKNIRFPDRLILDLDPHGAATFKDVLFAAHRAREAFEARGLNAFVMTTGSRGLHIVSAIETLHHIDDVRAYVRALAEELIEQHPDRFTIEQRKSNRGDRIFLDYMRNGFASTGVAPYSVRPIEGAPVATPVEWEELDESDFGPQNWRIANVRERVAERGDPWREIADSAVALDIEDT